MADLYFVGSGGRVPITNMFDVDGDETSNPAEAFTIVATLPDGRWLASQVREGDIVQQQTS